LPVIDVANFRVFWNKPNQSRMTILGIKTFVQYVIECIIFVFPSLLRSSSVPHRINDLMRQQDRNLLGGWFITARNLESLDPRIRMIWSCIQVMIKVFSEELIILSNSVAFVRSLTANMVNLKQTTF